jgi:hypothetical protein
VGDAAATATGVGAEEGPTVQEHATDHTGQDIVTNPEMIEITERAVDPRDACQRDHPMSFCSVCGTWLHCKRDDETEYRRREERE